MAHMNIVFFTTGIIPLCTFQAWLKKTNMYTVFGDSFEMVQYRDTLIQGRPSSGRDQFELSSF